MKDKIYSAVLNINFDDFDDFEEEEGVVAEPKVSDISRVKILKAVYLNLLMTLGPKVRSVFTNLEISNADKLHQYYNMIVAKMEEDLKNNNTENLIYDFFTVCKADFTEVNIGFSAKGVYVATVSTKKCLEQDLVSNYIEKNFLTTFLNETAKDTIRYSNLTGVDIEDVKNLFMYATIFSLRNGSYPIAFTPLSKYTKAGDDIELVQNKVRRIYRTLVENFGE